MGSGGGSPALIHQMEADARTASRGTTVALVASAALPAALVTYLSFESGGYFAGAPALVAAELAVLIAARTVLVRRPFAGVGPLVVVTALALGCFAGWVLASSGWSHAEARAQPEYTRALAYALTLVFFGMLPYSVRRIRWMTIGLATAATVVCLVALVSRTFPDVLNRIGELHPERLSYPLDYWNSLGLLAGLAIVLCGHLASSTRDHPVVRVAAAGAVPALAVTLYYTYSRGATWATAIAIVLYVLVGRSRGLLPAMLATAPPTLVALMTVHPAGDFNPADRFSDAALADGHRIALVVAGCMVAAAAIRAVLLRLDYRVERFSVPPRIARGIALSGATLVLALGLVGLGAFHVPDKVAAKYREFNSDSAVPGQASGGRLLSANDNGRREHWDVALEGFRRDAWRGAGAGTYELTWARHRKTPTAARDGHSLYFETLGELGIVGLGLLLVCLLVLFAGVLRRARGRDGPLFAALLGAGVLWGLAAGVDWAWEMPAVTLWLFALGGAALAVRPERQPAMASMHARYASVALRAAVVAGCLALAVLPARVAVSQARLEGSIASMHSGDCRSARLDARAALRALNSRASPHHVLAWCNLRAGRYTQAVESLQRALRNDPGSWSLLQASAVARASAGVDPRPQIRAATRLNPMSELAGYTRLALRGDEPSRWRRAGRRLPVAVPETTDP